MNFRFIAVYLAALALLAVAGAWWVFWPVHGGGGQAMAVIIPLGSLVLAALAIGHLGMHARGWARDKQQQLDRRSAQLEEAREAYQALLDHSDILIFTMDEQGRYLTMNRYGLRLLGAILGEIQGKYIEEHLDQAGAVRLRELLQTALQDGQAGRNLEPLCLGGRERFMNIHLKMLEGNGRLKRRVLVLMQDQTEQKLVDERMWQTEKLASLGLLAAGVAHQINNPLGILMGFGQLLLEATEPGEPGHHELGIILEQGSECKRIVDGLLSFTRLSDLGSGGCDLLTGLHAVIDTIRPVLKSQGVELDLDLPVSLPICRASGGSMQQVFLNLIANAMDAMPGGGRLMVSAQPKTKEPRQGSLHGTLPDAKSYVEIVFQDSGPGIAPENLERIYDPFFTTKPVGQGTGLGLSVVYGIVREQGGTITCQGAPSGDQDAVGACFIIRLPIQPDEAPEAGGDETVSPR